MMNDCVDGDMRDRLPGYVHGTLSPAERSVVAVHLVRCEDCAAELELITIASRAFAMPAVDVRAIVKALPVAPRRALRRTIASRAQRLAAAIGIVAIGAYSAVALWNWARPAVRSVAQSKPAVDAGATLAARAPSVPPPAVVDSPAGAAAPAQASAAPARTGMSFGGGISDLSDDQLDTLLGELDGLDALPSTEPETHLTPILPPSDGGHGAR